MPHSKFKERIRSSDVRVAKCPCAPTFKYTSERDLNIKFQMHHKFCPKLIEGYEQVRISKKAMTLREQQLSEAESIQRVHKNN